MDHDALHQQTEHNFARLTQIMIDLAQHVDQVEEQLATFVREQRATNARLDATLEAIKDLLQRPPNGH